MSVTLIFLLATGFIIAWWMAGEGLFSKPWLEAGPVQLPAGSSPDKSEAAVRIGLYVLLAVIGAFFSLFISAYLMRMASADWWAIPVPLLLWVNTCILVLNSLTLEWARREWRRRPMVHLRLPLLLAGLLITLFVAGQIEAWRQLMADGYLLADNPANSFFYMLSGLHGLHMLGGLAWVGHVSRGAFANETPPAKLVLNVDLCAIYCHFMLAVWLVLFALFAGWASDVADLCRQLIT